MSVLAMNKPPVLEIPRGRMLTANSIVRRWYLDADSERPIVSQRWVRENMPYKQTLSHHHVAWYEHDVAAVIAESRRLGIPIRDVVLPHLERSV